MRNRALLLARLLIVLGGCSLHCGDDEDSLERQCKDLTDEAYRKLDIAPADLSCNIDGDCALVRTDVSCLSGCGLPIAVSRAASVPERVERVENGVCADHERLGCPRSILLPCVPPFLGASAVCSAGRCEVQIPQ